MGVHIEGPGLQNSSGERIRLFSRTGLLNSSCSLSAMPFLPPSSAVTVNGTLAVVMYLDL